MLQPVDGLELAAHVKLLGGVEEVANSRVFLVTTEDLLRLDGPGVKVSVYPQLPAIVPQNDATLGDARGTGVAYLSGL